MSAAKLYIIVRADLPPGDRAVQAAHAAVDFQHQHAAIAARWQRESNTLAMLTVPDEWDLEKLLFDIAGRGLAFTTFREPDLGDSMTAIAVEAGAGKIVRKLPLAFKSA